MTPLLAYSALVCFLAMTLTWLVARLLNNAGAVDIAWSYLFLLIIGTFALVQPGAGWRHLLLGLMVGLWSLRLGTYLLIRVSSHHPVEDPRYAALRQAFPRRPWLMFFGFFQLQALLAWLLCIPFALAWSHSSSGLHPLEIAGFVLWLVALTGETLADRQLQRFKRDPANRGRTCRSGLWNYSRHPNYFFEWVIWLAYFLFVLASPWGWTGFYAPVLMLFFLLKMTGIPAAEARALATRGENYRQYQRTTSPFIPWFPKHT